MNNGNGNGHGDMKADEAAIELCEAIEVALSPLRLLYTSGGNTTSDSIDIEPCIEKFTRAFDSTYEGLEEQLDKEGGLSNVQLDMQIIERDARVGVGYLLGMRQAGIPMDEVKKEAIAMLARERRKTTGSENYT